MNEISIRKIVNTLMNSNIAVKKIKKILYMV